MAEEKINTMTQVKIENAIKILEEKLHLIPDVQSWAKEADVSRECLYRYMKIAYGKPPKIILREVRYEKIFLLINDEGVQAGCYSVAVDAGFRNAAALSKFLTAFYEKNFTELKAEILNGKDQLDFNWLNGIHK